MDCMLLVSLCLLLVKEQDYLLVLCWHICVGSLLGACVGLRVGSEGISVGIALGFVVFA